MTYYRLLRDNKESGPYSEEDLIAKGFKPYDLLWVEGKSAGWRYPSEIPSFKNIAPAIEEQPYDRFYKKQPAQKLFSEERTSHPSFSNITNKVSDNLPTAPSSLPVAERNYQPLPGRHIHVTLPSGNTVNLTTLVTKKENKELKEPTSFKNTPALQPVNAPVSKQPDADAAHSFAITNNEPVFINKPASSSASSLSWGLIAAAFIGIATLVGLGVMIGLSINRDKSDLAFNEAILNKSKQSSLPRTTRTDQANPTTGNVLPETTNTGSEATAHRSPAATKELVQNAVVQSNIVNDNPDTKATSKLPVEKVVTDQQASAHSNEKVLPAKPAPVNLEAQIVLTPNNFKTGAFGGISGLQYTLVNSSQYSIASVEVEIDYVQANSKIYKTEKLLFKDIAAGARVTVEAPSSSRGVKMISRIVKINAKDALSNTTAKS